MSAEFPEFLGIPPIEGMGTTGGFQRSLPQVCAYDATDADSSARPLILFPGRAAGPTLSSAVAVPPEHGAAFTSVGSTSLSILVPGLTVASTPTVPQPPESGPAVPVTIMPCAMYVGLLGAEVVLDELNELEIMMAIVLDELNEVEICVVLHKRIDAAMPQHATISPIE